MKIKFIDGKEVETDNMRDYIALQLEEINKFKNFCVQNGIFVWGFTLDSEDGGGGFFYMPKDEATKKKFIINMDTKLRELTQNRISLGFNDENGERIF